MTREDYSSRLRRRVRGQRLAFAVLLSFCIATVWALYQLVEAGPSVGIPIDVREYMLQTGPFDFSSRELDRLISSSSSISFSINALLLVYWFYFTSLGLMGFLLAFAPLALKKGLLPRPSWERGLIETLRIESGLHRFTEKRSLASKLALLRVVYRPRLYSLVAPIRRGWYKEPEHQWLQLSAVEPEARSILSTLRLFDSSLLRAVTLEIQIDRFLEGVRHLSEFFFAVASRKDPVLRTSQSVTMKSHDAEREILSRFVRAVRPGIIEVARVARRRKRPSRVINLITGVLRAPIVRSAVTISIVAAGIMILGVAIFDIPKAQAFLTWFTVTFGSLMISVGVESFRISRDPGRTERDAEP